MREVLYRALVLGEDLGQLTVDLPTPERDAVEYMYNAAMALTTDWQPVACSPDGLAIGASGTITMDDRGRLVLNNNEEHER